MLAGAGVRSNWEESRRAASQAFATRVLGPQTFCLRNLPHMAVARSRNRFEHFATPLPNEPPSPLSSHLWFPFSRSPSLVRTQDMVSHSSTSTESASSNDTVRPFNAEILDSEQAEQDVSRWLQTTNSNTGELYKLALNVTKHSRSNGHKILEALVGDVQVSLSHERLAGCTPPPKLESALFLDGEPRRIRVDACDIFLNNCDFLAKFLLLACGMSLLSCIIRPNKRAGG